MYSVGCVWGGGLRKESFPNVLNAPCRQVAIFTPPAMQTKMEESRVAYDGEGKLKTFITENL